MQPSGWWRSGGLDSRRGAEAAWGSNAGDGVRLDPPGSAACAGEGGGDGSSSTSRVIY